MNRKSIDLVWQTKSLHDWIEEINQTLPQISQIDFVKICGKVCGKKKF